MSGPRGLLVRRRAALPASSLLRSATSLMLSTGASAVLGVIYWILAARLFDAEDVGRDAALIAAMVELSAICQLNLDNGLVRFLPGLRERAGRAIAGAYAVNGVLALVLGTAFVLLVPFASDDFNVLRDEPLLSVVFVVGLALWGVFALQDAALVAMRRAPWVPVENVIFGVLKIAALPVALWLALDEGVFLGWIVPMAIVVVPITYLVFGVAAPRHRDADVAAPSALDDAGRRRVVGFLAQDYVGVVLGRAGITILPIVVVAVLGPESNAWFYVPFTIVISFDMIIMSVATSLIAEGSYAAHLVRDHVRTVVRRFGPLLALGVTALVVAAPIALWPFGNDYAREGADALRLLALACVPRAVIFLASAVWRIQGRGVWLLAVEALGLLLLVAMLLPLAHAWDLHGVALAWLLSWAVPGVAAAIWLVRFQRAGADDPRREVSTDGP